MPHTAPDQPPPGLTITAWLLLAALAYLWQRRGYRGPAETLLRKLVYR